MQIFKTFHFNENRLFIFRLQSEHSYSRNERKTNARFMDEALKTRGIKYLTLETWLLFDPPIKFLATCLVQLRGFFSTFEVMLVLLQL